jgi:peptide/nickel transport system substrate-binding protein
MERWSGAIGTPLWQNRRLSRRKAMRGGLVALGGGVFLVAGCSSSNNNSNAATATSVKPAVSASAAGTAVRPAGTGAPAGTARPGSPAAGGTPAASAFPLGKAGGNLVTIAADPTSLDPHTGQGGGDHQFFWTMHDNLVNYDQQGNLDPSQSLAQSWEIVGGTQITFKLRSGIKFTDGTAFDAAAVKFNIDRNLDPATKSAAFAQMSTIDSVQVVDPTTVVFKLKEPNAALLTNLGDRGGAIISPTAAQKFGKDYGRNPVGTGPFVLKEWVQSDHLTVSKNPNYWAKDSAGTTYPYLDSVRWNVVPDPTVALANLDAGTVDVYVLSPSAVDNISKNSKYQVTSVKGGGWSGVYVNQALAPLDDVHFRRALGRSIDKAAILQAVFFGKGVLGIGPLGASSWAFNTSLKGLDFDLTAAKQELAQSKNPNGAKVEIITINSDIYPQHTELWKQMASKIGIDLTITPLVTAELTNRDYVVKDAPLNLAGFSARVDPDGMTADVLGSQGFYNPGHQPNAQLDDLIAKARQTYDQTERKKLYDQVQQLAIDQVYDYYVLYQTLYAAGQSKVKNLNSLWGPEGKQRYKWLFLG